MNNFRYCKNINLIGVSSFFKGNKCSVFKLKLQSNKTFVTPTAYFTKNSFRFSELIFRNQSRLLQPTICHRHFCADSGKGPERISDSNQQSGGHKKISRREQLKVAVRDYGATVIVFHVAISLTSLGICYLLISNGLDAAFVLKAVGFSESIISSKVAVGGSTFVIAYAVHKLFAPLRIAITLSATPFIVRYLRRVGVLKLPKS